MVVTSNRVHYSFSSEKPLIHGAPASCARTISIAAGGFCPNFILQNRYMNKLILNRRLSVLMRSELAFILNHISCKIGIDKIQRINSVVLRK